MSLLSFVRRRPASQLELRSAPISPTRPVLIEWKDENGEKVWQQARLQMDRSRGLTAIVGQRPPLEAVAQVREAGSSYAVVILGANTVDDGFELQLDYFWEGRRREERVAANGPARLKVEGFVELEVEVVNVSAGGMQLQSSTPVPEGCVGRICGDRTERFCLVRCCVVAPRGFLIGVQFYGESRRERPYGEQ